MEHEFQGEDLARCTQIFKTLLQEIALPLNFLRGISELSGAMVPNSVTEIFSIFYEIGITFNPATTISRILIY